MHRLLIYLLAAAAVFASGTLTQRTVQSVEVAANMVWVAHYFPDVAVDLFDYMHRPTVQIEDPVMVDELVDELMAHRAYCRSE